MPTASATAHVNLTKAESPDDIQRGEARDPREQGVVAPVGQSRAWQGLQIE